MQTSQRTIRPVAINNATRLYEFDAIKHVRNLCDLCLYEIQVNDKRQNGDHSVAFTTDFSRIPLAS